MRDGIRGRAARVIAWAALAAWTTIAMGQESAGPRPAEGGLGDDIVLERDRDTQTLRIKIPARDNRVAWSDVLKVLMELGHLDQEVVQDKLPQGALDLTRPYSMYAITAANVWLAPDIRMQIVPASRSAGAHLLITVDEAAVLAKRRALTKRLRDRITKDDARPSAVQSGLQLPADWDQSDTRQPLVLVVHGFQSSSARFEPLAAALRASGLMAGTYSYPDDQPIASSAELLSRDLKNLASSHPQRQIALLAHSMGGLVARMVIEDPRLDPGNVYRLIMVATPNQGSLLARFAFGLEILEQVMPDAERTGMARFYAAIEDGLSEAAVDLQPDSVFLRQLNSRARNPKVQYTIFLGTGGYFTRRQVDQLRARLATAKSKSDVLGLVAPRIDETLADLDEVIRGLGDGVVAVKRGKLAGVDDVVVREFTHLGVLQQPAGLDADLLYKLILQRLQKK